LAIQSHFFCDNLYMCIKKQQNAFSEVTSHWRQTTIVTNCDWCVKVQFNRNFKCHCQNLF